MNEEEQVKKQLRKNMLFNLIAFSIILSVFGIFIYSKFYNSLYMSADTELQKVAFQGDVHKIDNPKKDIPRDEFKVEEQKDLHFEEHEENPRLIYIKRSSDGSIVEDQMIKEIFKDVDFDKDNLDEIYEIVLNEKYSYRGINYLNSDGTYNQVLINTDSEKNIAEKFKSTLVVAIVICVILIVIASYILSKRTLKPIVVSWKRQTEFVQDASHELRTPLTIIKAKQEKLLEKPTSTILDNAEDISITLKETR